MSRRFPGAVRSAGFTLVEVIITIAVIALLAAFSLETFTATNGRRALELDAARVTAMFDRARGLTLASRNSAQYGVHVGTNQVVIFQGASYDPATTSNQVELLNAQVTATTSLSAGVADIVFSRLTGTAATGTVTLTLIADPTQARSITIGATGLIEAH